MNALELLKAQGIVQALSFGCETLDKVIGGVPVQGITEIAGEAGCGKTQFCLTLSLQVQLDEVHGGKGGAAAYLSCGEGVFPIRRLSQLATAYETRTGIPNQQFLANVHIEQCYNIDDAQSILRHKIPELCRTKNIKLLIIDSLAGLVRFEYDSRSAQDMRARTALLFTLARELKLLSDIFKIGVLVVNQVKADFLEQLPPLAGLGSSHDGSAAQGLTGKEGGSVPALGMAWAYCVNTRITLHRDSARLRACPIPPGDVAGWTAATAESEAEGRNPAAREGGVVVKVEPAVGAAVGVKRGSETAGWGYDYGYGHGAGGRRGRVEEAFYQLGGEEGESHGGDNKENRRTAVSAAQVPAGTGLSKTPGLHPPPLHEAVRYYPFTHSAGGVSMGVGVASSTDPSFDPNSNPSSGLGSGSVAPAVAPNQGSGGGARSVRCIRLELSARRPEAQCGFEIGAWGVRAVQG